MSKKLVLNMALASMILGSSVPASAITPKEAALAVPFVWLGISAYALSYQHPVTNFQQKGAWSRILKAHQLLSKQDRKAYLQNISDVFWTRWIGQPYKDKEMKADLKTGKVKQSTRKLPAGFMGWFNTYLYTGVKASGLITTIGGAYMFLTHPEMFSNMGSYLQKKYGFVKPDTSQYQLNREALSTLELQNAAKQGRLLDAKLAKLGS